MNVFWLGLGVSGLVLQLVIIYLMTQGFYRRYPWVFLYLLILFLTGVADSAGAVDPNFWEQIYENIYSVYKVMDRARAYSRLSSQTQMMILSGGFQNH